MKSTALVNSLEIKNSMSYTVTGITLTCANASKLNGIILTGTGTVVITGAVTDQNYGRINCGGVTFSNSNYKMIVKAWV